MGSESSGGAKSRGSNPSRLVLSAVAVILAATLLFYSLRGIEWNEVWRIAAGASPTLLLLTITLASVSLFLRSLRWRVLLNAEGALPVQTVFWATAAGYFGNNFLPARGGEIVRTMLISSRSTLDTTYVLATALSERVADAVVLLAIIALALPAVPSPPQWLATSTPPIAILVIGAALVIAGLPRLERILRASLERAPLPDRLRPKLQAVASQALQGLRTFHDVPRLARFAGLTVTIWSLDALITIVGGAALGLAISLPAAFLLIASLGLGSALPSTPGYVGIYQFVAVTVLTPFGLGRTDAIAYILVGQALNYVVIGLWGALGLWRYRVDGAALKASSMTRHIGFRSLRR